MKVSSISFWLANAALITAVKAQLVRRGRFADLVQENLLAKAGHLERAIITYEMPSQDNSVLLAEALEAENAIIVPRKQINTSDGTLEISYGKQAPKVTPFRFGKALPISLNLTHSGDGEWIENSEAGTRMWRFKIHSPGAESISIYFDDFHLNPQAELYVIGQEVGMAHVAMVDVYAVLGNIWCFYWGIE